MPALRPKVYTHRGPKLPTAMDHAGVHREMVNPARSKPRHDGENYGGQHPAPAPASGLGGGLGGAGASIAGFGD